MIIDIKYALRSRAKHLFCFLHCSVLNLFANFARFILSDILSAHLNPFHIV